MPIKGLSQARRLPRAGIIRLGCKKKNDAGKEYPVETDYFICPDIVKKVYGDTPKELDIMFPVEDEEKFFQQFYKMYGNGVLLCRGDGEVGTFFDFKAGNFSERECPCSNLDSGKCKAIGILQFLLPKVKESAGVWQISTGSKNSIIDLNSGVEICRGMFGRIAMIPLILKRDLTETQKLDKTGVKKGRHYTMKLSWPMSIMEMQQLSSRPMHRALLTTPMPDETPEACEDLIIGVENGNGEPASLPEPEPEVEEKGFEEAEITSLRQQLDFILSEMAEKKLTLTAAEHRASKNADTKQKIQDLIDTLEERLSKFDVDNPGDQKLFKDKNQ